MSTIAYPVSTATGSRKGLNIALWVAQVLLFAAFAMAGTMKLTTPIWEMAQSAAWVSDMPGLVRFIGLSEIAGAMGVLLPSLTRIKPALTPIAALGLVTVMTLAVGYHLTHNEAALIGAPAALGLLSAFVVWGRFRAIPIGAKRRA